MSKSLFYSWQSQLPGKYNRYFIEDALERVQKALANDPSTHFTIEQDARGVVGAPEISAAILTKIAKCNIFVADVTPVGTLLDGKRSPNPNVMFELGYAWRDLGESRVILVLNQAYGVPEELPFDISKRGLIRYSCDDSAVLADVRKALVNQLQTDLLAMLHEDHLGVLREAGLSKSDLDVFCIGYSHMVEQDSSICGFDHLLKEGASRGLSAKDIEDATQIVSDSNFWNASPVYGPHKYSHVQMNAWGLEQYCKTFVPGYANLATEVGRCVVDGERRSSGIAKKLERPKLMIEHVLELLEQKDFLRVTKSYSGMSVLEIKPLLKRHFGDDSGSKT
jgi:hypothetical protein